MDNFFAEGTRVWLRDKDQLYPCTVSSCIDGSLVLTADYGTVHCLELSTVSREMVFPMHQTSVEGVEDMSTLTELHEAAIMHNLHLRYRQDKIYVRRDTESQETALQRHNKQMALPLL